MGSVSGLYVYTSYDRLWAWIKKRKYSAFFVQFICVSPWCKNREVELAKRGENAFA